MSLLEWLLLIVIVVLIPCYLFRKKAEVQFIFCLWRTKKGLNLIKKLSQYRIFSYLADLGIVFAFGIFGVLYLVYSERKKRFLNAVFDYLLFLLCSILLLLPTSMGTQSPAIMIILFIFGFGGLSLYLVGWATFNIIKDLLASQTPVPLLTPVIPGVEIPGVPINVPVSAWVSIIILMLVHEFSHAITSTAEKIKVKSMGLITAGLFPVGAFAEPDEKELKKTKMHKRMRIYAAGSIMNFVFAFIFLGLLVVSFNFMPSFTYYTEVVSVDANSPAEMAGIETGMRVYNLGVFNEEKIPGTPLLLVTDNGNITTIRNSTGSIGILFNTETKVEFQNFGEWFAYYYLEVVYWTAMLNFAVGMFNYLPFAIFDGGRMFIDLIDFYCKKLGIKGKENGKKALKVLSWAIGLMFLLNLGILFFQ